MPSPVRYAIWIKLVEGAGWTFSHNTKGSHVVWKTRKNATFSVPVHKNQVKHGYYRDAQKIIAREAEDG